jgi:hypothetical protein
MNDDDRQTWSMIIEVLDVLEKHGYRRGDDQHTGRAVHLVGDLARIYEGTQEIPDGARLVPEPTQASLDQAGRAAANHAEAIAGIGMPTILSALDEASDYKRDRAAGCADCADQSCGTCQYRLDAARAYESLATRLQHAMDAAAPGKSSRHAAADLPGNRIQAQAPAAPEREAGQ